MHIFKKSVSLLGILVSCLSLTACSGPFQMPSKANREIIKTETAMQGLSIYDYNIAFDAAVNIKQSTGEDVGTREISSQDMYVAVNATDQIAYVSGTVMFSDDAGDRSTPFLAWVMPEKTSYVSTDNGASWHGFLIDAAPDGKSYLDRLTQTQTLTSDAASVGISGNESGISGEFSGNAVELFLDSIFGANAFMRSLLVNDGISDLTLPTLTANLVVGNEFAYPKEIVASLKDAVTYDQDKDFNYTWTKFDVGVKYASFAHRSLLEVQLPDAVKKSAICDVPPYYSYMDYVLYEMGLSYVTKNTEVSELTAKPVILYNSDHSSAFSFTATSEVSGVQSNNDQTSLVASFDGENGSLNLELLEDMDAYRSVTLDMQSTHTYMSDKLNQNAFVDASVSDLGATTLGNEYVYYYSYEYTKNDADVNSTFVNRSYVFYVELGEAEYAKLTLSDLSTVGSSPALDEITAMSILDMCKVEAA